MPAHYNQRVAPETREKPPQQQRPHMAKNKINFFLKKKKECFFKIKLPSQKFYNVYPYEYNLSDVINLFSISPILFKILLK